METRHGGFPVVRVDGLSQIQAPTFYATYGVRLRKSYHYNKCT